MGTAKWIKLPNDFFHGLKTEQLQCQPRGKEIVLFFLELLCLASRLDQGGVFLSANTPLTEKDFSAILKRRESFVKNALELLLKFGLIDKENKMYFIAEWYDYESEDRLEKLRAYDRVRKRKARAKAALMEDFVRWTQDGNSAR
ncbi:MAG: phage replisome organizer N-terminal domain-containing protein [Clostridia bacterium]|nr:phage replisome organizer N-terminal domain-containing protein [Clostridia bacterium]